jgi:CHRD domain
MRNRSLPIILVLGSALLLCSVAVGASTSSFTLRSTLTAKQQVPKQHVAAPRARATFSATLIRARNGRGTLRWTLTYSRLTSRVTKALLIVPQVGRRPAVVVEFCTRCAVHGHGVLRPLPAITTKALAARRGYVSIRTKRNPKGEVRGRLIVRR